MIIWGERAEVQKSADYKALMQMKRLGMISSCRVDFIDEKTGEVASLHQGDGDAIGIERNIGS